MSEYEVLVNPVVIGIKKTSGYKNPDVFYDYYKNNLIKTAPIG